MRTAPDEATGVWPDMSASVGATPPTAKIATAKPLMNVAVSLVRSLWIFPLSLLIAECLTTGLSDDDKRPDFEE